MPIRVIQVEDVGNLPLALNYATPVIEQGRVIAHLPRSDHGLDYAAHQYRLIQGKFHLIKTVGVEVRVHHEDDPHSRLRRAALYSIAAMHSTIGSCRKGAVSFSTRTPV